jgi:hypothetical protein
MKKEASIEKAIGWGSRVSNYPETAEDDEKESGMTTGP